MRRILYRTIGMPDHQLPSTRPFAAHASRVNIPSMPDRMAEKPAPDAASLREAALAHLARFAATEAGLARVLARRVDRWERAGGDAVAARAARAAIPGIVRDLATAGAVDDAAFAVARARRLARAGASRRAVTVHLASRGVSAEIAQVADPESAERDYTAALAYARRRRIGPFGTGSDGADRLKELAKLARAGFSRAVAERVLATEAETAEALLLASRRA